MSKTSRTKGARGENEVAATLQHLLADPTIVRNLNQYQEGGRDLAGDSIDAFHCEVKRRSTRTELRIALWVHTTELAATTDTESPRIPVVICREDNSEWRAYPCLTLQQFADYVEGQRLLVKERQLRDAVDRLAPKPKPMSKRASSKGKPDAPDTPPTPDTPPSGEGEPSTA